MNILSSVGIDAGHGNLKNVVPELNGKIIDDVLAERDKEGLSDQKNVSSVVNLVHSLDI